MSLHCCARQDLNARLAALRRQNVELAFIRMKLVKIIARCAVPGSIVCKTPKHFKFVLLVASVLLERSSVPNSCVQLERTAIAAVYQLMRIAPRVQLGITAPLKVLLPPLMSVTPDTFAVAAVQ